MGAGLKASSISYLPLLLTWSCKASLSKNTLGVSVHAVADIRLNRLSTHQIFWHPGLPGSGLHFGGLHTGLSTHPGSSSWCSGCPPLLQLFHWPQQQLLWHSGLCPLCPLERKMYL